MDINNTVIESVVNTLNNLMINANKGTNTFLQGEVVHVQIEFVGNIHAYYIMEMELKTAINLANIMFQGMMTVSSFDEMCKSTIGEICNMVSGGICTSLSNIGIISDIKPPFVDTRKDALNPQKAVTIMGNNNPINTYFIVV